MLMGWWLNQWIDFKGNCHIETIAFQPSNLSTVPAFVYLSTNPRIGY